MRRFTIAGVLALAFIGTAGAQFFDPPALADRNGSQGFWFYMLEVPDPAAMKIDAYSDDWAWFDLETARHKIHQGQRPFLDDLERHLGRA